MNFVLTFSDSSTLTLSADTYLCGWKSYNADSPDKEYHAEPIFKNQLSATSAFQTDEELAFLQGLLHSVSWISTTELPNKRYKTSSIVKIELC